MAIAARHVLLLAAVGAILGVQGYSGGETHTTEIRRIRPRNSRGRGPRSALASPARILPA